ncbi:MAG: hypothetical protein PHE73_03670 [Sulfurovaceae bacterium]|nr:hypothetical protein [Sulfurovaceae bacterium]
MKTIIINQYGKYLQGAEFDEILDAHNKDVTTVVFRDKKVKIVEVTKNDNEQIIKVEIE